MLTDQDVLGALLGSTEFANIPVQFFRRGRDIIQHSSAQGYAPLDRIANLVRGMPPLIHSQCAKPWDFPEIPSLLAHPRQYYAFLYLENSTYLHCARQYGDVLGSLPPFLETRSWPGKVSQLLSLGNPHLRGITQSVVGLVHEYASWAWHKGGRLVEKMGAHALGSQPSGGPATVRGRPADDAYPGGPAT